MRLPITVPGPVRTSVSAISLFPGSHLVCVMSFRTFRLWSILCPLINVRCVRMNRDMKVLITGGMGVIGAETSRKFVREGHRPVVFARHSDESLIGDIIDKI